MDRAVFFQFLFYCDLVLEIWINILFFQILSTASTQWLKMIIYNKKNTMRFSALIAILNESD